MGQCSYLSNFDDRSRKSLQYNEITKYIMKQLQKYKYEANKPLTDPYSKDGIYNAYYKGFETDKNRQVLISEYFEQRYERLLNKQKRLLKLKEIKHPNIAEIYDIILDKENKRMYVVLEWCAGGNLYDYEKSNSTLDCDVAVKILLSLMTGLKELHDNDQMHRHINMENIQFDGNGNPKLSFRCLYPKMYYLSPEDIQAIRNRQNDVFSLGVLFYKILLGQTPFKSNTADEQMKAIQEGPKFPKDDLKMFPLAIPNEIKNLIINMTLPKAQDRWSGATVIEECKNFLKKMCKTTADEPNLPKTLTKKIYKQDFVPIFVRHTGQQEHVIIALNPVKHQFTKFHIFKSKSKNELQKYVDDVLSPYREVKDQMQIVPIFDNSIIDDEYLVIRTFYDNQGSLKFYLDHSGKIQLEQARSFTEKLMGKLKRFGKTHNHLTTSNVLIKGGIFYINYPPFLTKQYVNSLKNSKNQVDFIAPQVKDGKPSQNADAWSVAMLKYMLQNHEVPKFDKNGKIILPNKAAKSKEQIDFFENALVKDQKKRKTLEQIEKIPELEQVALQKQIADKQRNDRQKSRQRKDKLEKDRLQKQRQQKLQREKAQRQRLQQARLRKLQQKLEEQERKKAQQQRLKNQKLRKQKQQEARAKAKKDRQKIKIQEIKAHLPKTKQVRKTFGQVISQKLHILHPLEKHWTKPLRVGIKCIIGVILLIFLYYWSFFLINGQLITEHSLYEVKNVEIRAFSSDPSPQINYNLVTKTPAETYTQFYNKTLSVLRDDFKCVLNDYSVQSDVVSVLNSSSFTTYQIFGILFTIINLIIFCLSLSKMDFPKVFFISKLEQNDFNQIWNWMFINMALATQISFIYLLYGSLFHMNLEPCLQKATLTAVEFLLKKWQSGFNIRFIWIYLGLIFSYAVTLFFIIKPQYILHKYAKAGLVALYLAGTFCRIMGGSGGHVAWEKQSVFGKVGELLLLIISVIYLIEDLVFGCCVKNYYPGDNNKINKVNDDSNMEINQTQENFLPQ